ncbi:MAG: hypothetical protein QXU40_01270 [Candidatus Pacearchaeota archaeon]
MVASIPQLIGKINPKLYSRNWKQLIEEYGSFEKIPAEKIDPKSLTITETGKIGEIELESFHKIIYDSPTETLEPVYFFIVDLMNDLGLKPEKLVDNFTSSPGSGHFAELGQRAATMQQQVSKILGDVNIVLKSILNLIYDLKEFKIRLSYYDELKTDKRDAALLALKQIWMDRVDINKGNSSIKAMALGQAGFQTLIDAFLFIKDVSDVDKIDLNERVKRILKGRILEFNHWLEDSEKELRKRYSLEKEYLRSQVNSLKLYSRWVRPYLKAAQDLEMKEVGREPSLVKTFNTLILELSLWGKKKLDIKEEVAAGYLPDVFKKAKTRDYYSCVLVELKFRGIPQRAAQQPHYLFGGRVEMSFRGYVLNEDELKRFDEEFEESNVGDMLKLVEGATGSSLEKLQEEINFFLEEKEDNKQVEKKEAKKEERSEGSNPFVALFGGYEKKQIKKQEKKEERKTPIKNETYLEKEYLRPLCGERASSMAFLLFDTYKKAHGMVSYT